MTVTCDDYSAYPSLDSVQPPPAFTDVILESLARQGSIAKDGQTAGAISNHNATESDPKQTFSNPAYQEDSGSSRI